MTYRGQPSVPGLLGDPLAFLASSTTNSPTYNPRRHATRVDIMGEATRAGTLQLGFVDERAHTVMQGTAVTVSADELYAFKIDILVRGCFGVFLRFVDTSGLSGTVRFWANDDHDAQES